MLINLSAGEQGEWFYFFESHIDQATGEVIYADPVTDARVQIRRLSPFIEKLMEGKKREFQNVLNPKTRAMERISYYPDLTPEQAQKEREDTWDYVITGIENFKDSGTGKEIACTRENKIKLMALPVFDRFVARCLQILSNSGIEAKKAETKNS